MYLKKIN